MAKARKVQKNQLIPFICFCVTSAALAVCVAALCLASADRPSQQAAERFKGETGEGRYAQVSAFFPPDRGLDMQGIYSFRATLKTKLTEASLEEPETGSLWQDGFSCKTKLTAKSEKSSSETMTYGVGGDFFLFHPLELLSGRYIYESDLMHDSVLLDEALAWKLYGGTDLEGMTVVINDYPFIIAGVVRLERDKATGKALEAGPVMFMHYDALSAIQETKIDCYELVCADPISGYAKAVLGEAMKDAVTVQNTGRFSLSSTVRVIGKFSERSMASTGVIFPYWENAARIVENNKAFLLLAALLAGLFPLICLTWLAVWLWGRARGWWLRTVPPKWEAFKDGLRERQRLRIARRAKDKEQDLDELYK